MNSLKLSSTIEARHKCRCCTQPAVNSIKLESFVNKCGVMEKTYREIFNEITNLDVLRIPPCKEHILPQQICMECGTQIVNSYKFIQQACKVTELYLRLEEEQNTQDDFKSLQETLVEITEKPTVDTQDDFKSLQETLMEITEKPTVDTQDDFKSLQDTLMEITEKPAVENDYKEIKIEPLNIEFSDLTNAETGESEPDNGDRDYIDNSKEENSSEEEEYFKPVVKEKARKYSCNLCSNSYVSKYNLRYHIRRKHIEKTPEDENNAETDESEPENGDRDYIGNSKEEGYFKPVVKEKARKYSCNLCSNSYVSKYNLRYHIRRKHIEKTPEDEIKTENMKLKRKTSNKKERLLCPYCGKSYSFSNSLKIHIRTHTGERPFTCDICNKTFRRKIGLTMHRVVHSDEKPHKCHVCGKGFKIMDKLKFHMRVHSELRPFKCNQCEKSFKYACVLKSHMYMHTGELPFACKTCGVAFSLRTSLNYHCLKNAHEK